MSPLIVAAAAVVLAGRLLVVSKQAAPEVFYLPGGKPEPGESLDAAVHRELREELGVGITSMRQFAVVEELAALEAVPMRMTVYLADLDREPEPAAELADLAWISGPSEVPGQLAPTVHHHVVPWLSRAGLLEPPGRRPGA